MNALRPEREIVRGRFVHLDPLTVTDAAELREAIGSPEVFAGGYGGGPAGLAETADGFASWTASYYQWDRGNVYGVRLADGTLVGTTTLGDFDEANESTHIGWTAYSPWVWGSVVNVETKLLLLGLAFDSGFGRVRIQADSINTHSRAAILKLGATFEGVNRRVQKRADGTWRDTAVYSILREEWPAVRSALEERLVTSPVPARNPVSAEPV